ncbi:hypothetical protein SAMN05216503_3291 [Polaribacter sp. KT25b]|uniref:hypothetical protein n=1 Tax=Polaribacter sp. KT25b TaxID=1855336 RepID=UPI00087A29B2|nr:hypothetical protein [Polaribacter sp. KT25b]SDS50997.1 hypothetical protein SAMN05216503_3291 [Polaribacter sp. KT25b]
MKKEEIKIAGNLTVNDWKDIKEKLETPNNKLWGLAVHFFEERIKTRYLDPIHAIQKLNINEGEGFTMLNLQCSLIETFECFINGWLFYLEGRNLVWKDKEGKVASYNNKVNSRQIFISFFDKFKDEFHDLEGRDFYSNVRCGLLHETQTKGNWIIRVDTEDTKKCYKYDDGNYIIYRNNFQEKLEQLLEEYRKAIVDGKKFKEIGISTEDLRDNFIAKFNHICEQS